MGEHFTPGPWFWDISPSGEIRLATPDRGRLYVMSFARQGMRGAQPRFSLWGDGPRERKGGVMHNVIEAGGGNHPDARLIATAPDLLAMVKRYASECGECGGSGRNVIYDTATYIGQECSPIGDEPCEACADIRSLIARATGETK